MTVRTSQTSDTFTRPFSLSGIDEVQAAGTYTVQLAIDTPDGIVLIVGCSDPTIEKPSRPPSR